MDPALAQSHDRIAALEQENARLRSLCATQRSHLETLQQENDRLQKSAGQERAQLLSTIAQVANLLLKSPDYTTVLPDVVRLLGETVGSDRCAIAQDVLHPTLGVPAAKVIVEWCQERVISSFEATPELADTLPWQDLPELYDKLLQGETANYLVSNLSEPNRSLFAAQGVTSVVYIPIVADGKGWGQIGFDNCGEPRLYDEAEIAILRIAADSLAAAIERQVKDDELRKSESLYRSLFEISNEGIYRFEFDPSIPLSLSLSDRLERGFQDNRIIMANRVFAEQYGLNSPEDIVGHRVNDFYIENSQINIETNERLFSGDFRVFNEETEEVDAFGHRRYFLSNVVALVEDDYITGGWGTQIDITELREAQQASLQAERERVAQLEDYNQQLRSREHWLEATALAANALVAYPNLEAALDEALRLIGETVRCDRVAILQHIHDESGTGFARGIHEWNSQHAFRQILTEYIDFPWSAMGLEDWLILGQAGELCGGVLDELPEPFRSIQAELDVQATYNVPIFVASEFWGVLGIDYCREPKRLIAAEVGIFKTIASCIGSAIERQHTQEAILQAEQERSQQLECLNTELQQAIDRLSESEERYRTLFEISSEGIYRFEYEPPISINSSVDEQVNLIYQRSRYPETNATFTAMYGLNSSKDNSNLRLADLHVEESEQNRTFMQALVENRHQIRNYESEEHDRHGNPRYFLNNISTIIKDGCAIGGWASQLDITELRLAQQALLEAEQQRVAELAKANEALKRSLDCLASEPSLDKFLGQVLSTIAAQFDSPMAEYWYHQESLAFLGMMSLSEQIYDREAISQRYPTHPGVEGFLVPPAMIHGEDLNHRKQPFIVEDWLTTPFTKEVKWMPENGLYKHVNVPMVLGDRCIGALVVHMSREHQITTQQIELAQALAHQATLAVQLMQLAAEAQQAAIYEERNRLASEIHDTLAQAFTGISLQIEAAKPLIEQDPQTVRCILDHLSHLSQIGLTEARRSVWALYPPAEKYADLAQMLYESVEQMTRNTSTQIEVNLQGTPCPLTPLIGMNLLRIGQEALTNALKHAQAQIITLELTYDRDRVSLLIRDDGRGFIPPTTPNYLNSGFGLMGMYERCDRIGAQLSLSSQLGQGTQIIVEALFS
jgi:PAS domain S-box-containing protein